MLSPQISVLHHAAQVVKPRRPLPRIEKFAVIEDLNALNLSALAAPHL
jgi:hypothetical protein